MMQSVRGKRGARKEATARARTCAGVHASRAAAAATSPEQSGDRWRASAYSPAPAAP
jgi:hypothetical protein